MSLCLCPSLVTELRRSRDATRQVLKDFQTVLDLEVSDTLEATDQSVPDIGVGTSLTAYAERGRIVDCDSSGE